MALEDESIQRETMTEDTNVEEPTRQEYDTGLYSDIGPDTTRTNRMDDDEASEGSEESSE